MPQLVPSLTEVGGFLVLEWGDCEDSVEITREALEALVECVNDARRALMNLAEMPPVMGVMMVLLEDLDEDDDDDD
jgi:hypothetical protein